MIKVIVKGLIRKKAEFETTISVDLAVRFIRSIQYSYLTPRIKVSKDVVITVRGCFTYEPNHSNKVVSALLQDDNFRVIRMNT